MLRAPSFSWFHREKGGRPRGSHLDAVEIPMRTPSEDFRELRDALLETYAVNDAMNQLLLAHLKPEAWRAQLPGAKPHAGRTIAAIFAHLHNSRLVWLKHNTPLSSLSCAARPLPLHHEASRGGAQAKRGPVPAHADRRSGERAGSEGQKIFAGKLDAHVACGRNHVRLHVLARGPSSRPDFATGASARLSASSQGVGRNLAMGQTLERARIHGSAAISCHQAHARGLFPWVR